MPSQTNPTPANAERKPPSFAEQAVVTVKILVLVAGVLGVIWLLDIIAT